MHILFIIDHLRHDGSQRKVKLLAEGLTSRGHQCSILCLNDSSDPVLLMDLTSIPVDIRVVGKSAIILGHGLLSTWNWIRHEKFDCAATLLFHSDFLGRILAKAAGVPRIVTSIEARNVHYKPWQRWIVRHTAPLSDAFLINTYTERQFIIDEEGAAPPLIFYVPTSIRVSDYQRPTDAMTVRRQFKLSADDYLIGCIGRLTYQKGYDLMLDALPLIYQNNVHVVLIGKGEDEPKLRQQASKLGISTRVHFAGHRHDIPSLLGELNLYVHPSRWEGMPASLVEAMAAGIPVVTTNVDGNRELIPESSCGWLVPPDDVRALVKAVQSAIDDPVEARRRGVAAQRRAITHFDIEGTVLAWENILMGAAMPVKYDQQ